MAENFPNLERNKSLQIKKSEKTPNRKNSREVISRHIINRLLKTKDKKVLNATREKPHVTDREKAIRMTVGF